MGGFIIYRMKRNKYPAHLNFPFLDIAIDYFYLLNHYWLCRPMANCPAQGLFSIISIIPAKPSELGRKSCSRSDPVLHVLIPSKPYCPDQYYCTQPLYSGAALLLSIIT